MELPTVDSSSNDPLAVAADLHDASIAIPRQSISISYLAVLHSALDSTARKRLQVFERWLKSILLGQHAEAVRRSLEPCERSEKSERHRSYQMLIACAFMVMAFQGALYPPGGVWEDDHANDPRAGTSKLSYTSPAIYIVFASANTLWFLSSTMLLGLLQMGLPMKNKLRASTFMVAVCSAVVVSGSWLVVLAEGGYML